MNLRPLIIAHRGASAYAPENTLPAFALAVEQGADMIELDVLSCADGTPIVFHDDTTARWDGFPRLVAACSLAEMQALDIGGARVPTFAEVCIFAQQQPITLNVELKDAACVESVVALLRAYGLGQRVLLSSFEAVALHRLRAAAPDMRRAYLMGARSLRPTIRIREGLPFLALRAVAASAWNPADDLPLLRWLLPLARRAGYAVNVWTVDEPARMRELAAWGASGIITNDPLRARAAFSPS
jgi:glycerophosphoryl diester phosphodiesterase